MEYTPFEKELPKENQLLSIADPETKSLCYGYLHGDRLYRSAEYRNGTCVYAVGVNLKVALMNSPNLSWSMIGQIVIKPSCFHGEVGFIF